MPTSVLLSIKPQFAEAILSGSKKFEYRRAVFRNPDVQRVVIYASSPIQRVVGEFLIDDLLNMTLDTLWGATSDHAGIERSYFDRYFVGKESGFALKVRQPHRYPKPLHLLEGYGIRRPPQSFCYIA